MTSPLGQLPRRAALALAASLLAAPSAVRAEGPSCASDEENPRSAPYRVVSQITAGKKHEYLAGKQTADGPSAEAAEKIRNQWHAELAERRGKPAAPVINIYYHWTHEFFPVDVPEPKAEVSKPAELVDNFFRCHFTNQPTEMDARLWELLIRAAAHFKATRVNIVSGFRSKKYNLILRKKGRNVARSSQHTLGKAVDFRIPGVSVTRLYNWVKSHRLGGVGIYKSSRFVHADTGRVRYWSGR